MSEIMRDAESVREAIERMLRAEAEGEKSDEGPLSGIPPEDMLKVLSQLANKFPPENIMRFYKRYIEVVLTSLPEDEKVAQRPPTGHPLKTLFDENREALMNAGELAVYGCVSPEAVAGLARKLRTLGFTHYDREEMILFPYLEKKGIGAVVTSLWRSHDGIRDNVRELNRLISGPTTTDEIKGLATEISISLADVAMREIRLLYPTAHALLTDGEWIAIKEQEGGIGYYGSPPEDRWKTDAEPVQAYEADPHITDEQMASLPPRVRSILRGMTLVGDYYDLVRNGDTKLDNGYLLPDEINAIFNRLPVDLTFIDSDDRVRFFSGGGRSFPRTKSVLGRMVWFCHPPKSVSTVEKIIEAFRNGEKDEAAFWITINGRLMHIRYFAVRDKWGDYIGTLEMVQDITDLKRIEGERRLLDWED